MYEDNSKYTYISMAKNDEWLTYIESPDIESILAELWHADPLQKILSSARLSSTRARSETSTEIGRTFHNLWMSVQRFGGLVIASF